jgi:hypothetical protein
MTKRAKHPMLNTGEIDQEIRTPGEIIARVVMAFGGREIALDPCAPTRSDPSFYAERYVREAENGLAVPWVDRTFVNPPFDPLEPWLEKAQAEAKRGIRIVVLAPWRTHRPWFRTALASADSVTIEPLVRFCGFRAGFPAPIALLSWRCVVPPAPGGIVGAFLPPNPEIQT